MGEVLVLRRSGARVVAAWRYTLDGLAEARELAARGLLVAVLRGGRVVRIVRTPRM